mmetsp:Transcript_19998/g.75535  ORF Transcript_19998/g.75535 Transcript_19998/m.75535 type:complete len:300 (+) Transcript_19998:206-1105(+)
MPSCSLRVRAWQEAVLRAQLTCFCLDSIENLVGAIHVAHGDSADFDLTTDRLPQRSLPKGVRDQDVVLHRKLDELVDRIEHGAFSSIDVDVVGQYEDPELAAGNVLLHLLDPNNQAAATLGLELVAAVLRSVLKLLQRREHGLYPRVVLFSAKDGSVLWALGSRGHPRGLGGLACQVRNLPMTLVRLRRVAQDICRVRRVPMSGIPRRASVLASLAIPRRICRHTNWPRDHGEKLRSNNRRQVLVIRPEPLRYGGVHSLRICCTAWARIHFARRSLSGWRRHGFFHDGGDGLPPEHASV